MNQPVVSVVMGVYNGSAYLAETIESVLFQAERNFEFIIVDDGSTDGEVARILSGYEKQDGRLRVITKSNEGLTRALIDGCAVAQGKYIARIDVGDVMLPNRLKKQREVLDTQPGVVFVSCWTEYCGPEWEPLYTHREQTAIEGVNILPTKPGAYPTCGPTHHGSVMFRRKAYESVGGYRPEFYYGQDWDLWFRLAERCLFFVYPEVLCRVRLFPNSISGLNRERQEQIGRCALDAYWCRRRGESENSALVRALAIRPDSRNRSFRLSAGAGSHFIGELLRKRRDARCKKYFREALKINPLRCNTLFRLIQSTSIRINN